jgi:hypothetical protein
MDSKEIIAKLIKIAKSQQKVIEKLSQTVVPNASQSPTTPTTQLTHNAPKTFQAAILEKMTDPNKVNIPATVGMSINGDTLTWFTRNRLQQAEMVNLQKNIIAAVGAVKQTGAFPDLQEVKAVKYQPFDAKVATSY